MYKRIGVVYGKIIGLETGVMYDVGENASSSLSEFSF